MDGKNAKTVKEIAEQLGVSKTSVTRAAQSKGITAQMVGNKYVYTANEVAAITAAILKQPLQTQQEAVSDNDSDASANDSSTTVIMLQSQVEMLQSQITQLKQQIDMQQSQIVHLQNQLEAKDRQIDNKDQLLSALQGTVDGLNQSLQASQTLQAATIAALPQRSSIWDKFRRKKQTENTEDEG